MQPQEYTRGYNFTTDDGDNTNHRQLDTELDNISNSINQARDCLAQIQKDDGSLKDGIVSYETLDSTLVATITDNVTDEVRNNLSNDGGIAQILEAVQNSETAAAGAKAAALEAKAAVSVATDTVNASKADVQKAKEDAQSAQNSAQTAQTDAQNAQKAAQNAAQSAERAAQNAQNAMDAVQNFGQKNADWLAQEGVQQILNKPTRLSQFENDLNYVQWEEYNDRLIDAERTIENNSERIAQNTALIHRLHNIYDDDEIPKIEDVASDVEANKTAIAKNTEDISTLKIAVDKNTADIASDRALMGANAAAIAANTAAINAGNIAIQKNADDINVLYKRISNASNFGIEVVEELPTANISATTIYLRKVSEESGNLYEEYIYVNNQWELLGTARVDLTNYYDKSEIDAKFTESNAAIEENAAAIENLQQGIDDVLDDVYTKSEVDAKISGVSGEIPSIPQDLVIDADYNHTDNNYTNEDKQKLEALDVSGLMPKTGTNLAGGDFNLSGAGTIAFGSTNAEASVSADGIYLGVGNGAKDGIYIDSALLPNTPISIVSGGTIEMDGGGLILSDDMVPQAGDRSNMVPTTKWVMENVGNSGSTVDLTPYAQKAGDTFTGTITAEATNMVQGGKTANGSYKDFSVLREDGKRIAVIRFQAGANSNQVLITPCSLETGAPLSPFPLNMLVGTNGTPQAKSVTPPADSNSNNIATTEWVRALLESAGSTGGDYLPLNGANVSGSFNLSVSNSMAIAAENATFGASEGTVTNVKGGYGTIQMTDAMTKIEQSRGTVSIYSASRMSISSDGGIEIESGNGNLFLNNSTGKLYLNNKRVLTEDDSASSSGGSLNIWRGTQAEYNALDDETKADASKLFVINHGNGPYFVHAYSEIPDSGDGGYN